MEEILIDKAVDQEINKDYIHSIYNGESLDISFLFKSSFENTKYLRDYLFMILDVLGVDNTRKNRFVLITDELSNNAIEYGSENGSINKFRFFSKKEGKSLLINIEVEDNGNGEKSKKAKDMLKLKKERLTKGFKNYKSIRGRGLFMITVKLVDKLYFKDSKSGGLIVGVKKKLTI